MTMLRLVCLAPLALLLPLITACADTPSPVEPDGLVMAKSGSGGGKLKPITAAQLGFHISMVGPVCMGDAGCSLKIACPEGKQAIAGGWKTTGKPSLVGYENRPKVMASGDVVWRVSITASDGLVAGPIEGFAVCINE